MKWSDVKGNSIHIHSQQNDEKRDGVKVYYYNPTTKNEKGVSNNGRFIPLTNRIREILDELKAKQKALGIHSEWVFCKEDGSWTTTVSYYESLYKVSKKLGLNLKYYTFARTDEYIDELCEKINAFDDETRENPIENEMGTSGYLKIVPFQAKEKSPQTAKSQAFL